VSGPVILKNNVVRNVLGAPSSSVAFGSIPDPKSGGGYKMIFDGNIIERSSAGDTWQYGFDLYSSSTIIPIVRNNYVDGTAVSLFSFSDLGGFAIHFGNVFLGQPIRSGVTTTQASNMPW
jgi:hypothetical protein